MASCHIFGAPAEMSAALLPYGIYTIPEISMVGKTEASQRPNLTSPLKLEFQNTKSWPKRKTSATTPACWKFSFHPDKRKVLGVHVIGESAAENGHIGQAVLTFGGTMDYFRDTVFPITPRSPKHKQSRRP